MAFLGLLNGISNNMKSKSKSEESETNISMGEENIEKIQDIPKKETRKKIPNLLTFLSQGKKITAVKDESDLALVVNTTLQLRYNEVLELRNYTSPSISGNEIEFTDIRTLPAQILNSDGSPTRVLIVSHVRTGSKFFSTALGQYPFTAAFLEPLRAVAGMGKVDDEETLDAALHLLELMLQCDYVGIEKFLTPYRSNFHFFTKFVEGNRHFSEACKLNQDSCLDPRAVSEVCSQTSLYVIKAVKLYLKDANRLMDKYPKLKIIHLLRDPRAIYNSRQYLFNCASNERCGDPRYICENLRDDVNAIEDFKNQYPDRYLLLRYEDLATEPYSKMSEILEYLDLKNSSSVLQYLDTHTHVQNDNDPMSTFRNSSTTSTRWMETISWSKVKEIQNLCGDVIENLNYQMYDNYKHFIKSAEEMGITNSPANYLLERIKTRVT